MSAWTAAALVLLAVDVPACVWALSRGGTVGRLIGFCLLSSVVGAVFLLLPPAYDRPSYQDLALVLSVLAPAGRWSSPASSRPQRRTRRGRPRNGRRITMTAGHVTALVLLWTGVAFVLLSALALVRLRGTPMRLHALAPASCAGLPLIAAAVAVDQGAGRAAAKTLFTGLLFTAAAPPPRSPSAGPSGRPRTGRTGEPLADRPRPALHGRRRAELTADAVRRAAACCRAPGPGASPPATSGRGRAAAVRRPRPAGRRESPPAGRPVPTAAGAGR
ncbi:monovalent cation/H(+) antiporter subunit G [Kitasatospora arboriphila]